MTTVSGENGHQLLERTEGLSEVELEFEVRQLDEIQRERRVVVRVIPLPRAATLVVVLEHPDETFDVREGNALKGRTVTYADAKLVVVVAISCALLSELHNIRETGRGSLHCGSSIGAGGQVDTHRRVERNG